MDPKVFANVFPTKKTKLVSYFEKPLLKMVWSYHLFYFYFYFKRGKKKKENPKCDL